MTKLDLFLIWAKRHDLYPVMTANEQEEYVRKFRAGETPWESAEELARIEEAAPLRPAVTLPKVTLEGWT